MAFANPVEEYSAYTAGPGGGEFSIPLPATVNAGELLVIAFNYRAGNQALVAGSAATDFGFTEIVNRTRGTRGRLYVWTKEAVGDEGGTTLNLENASSSDAHAQYVVYRIQSWDAVHSSDADGSSNSANPPSLTVPTGAADHLWLAFCAAADDGASVDTFPTDYADGGYERRTPPVTNSSATVGWARRNLNAASEDPDSFGLSESESWVTATVAVTPGTKGAPAGGTSVSATKQDLVMTPSPATLSLSAAVRAAIATLTLTAYTASVSVTADMLALADNFDSALGTSLVTNGETLTPAVDIFPDDQPDQTDWITFLTRYTGCLGKTPVFSMDMTDARLTEAPDDPDWQMVWRPINDTDPGTGRIRDWFAFDNGTGGNTGPDYVHVFSNNTAFAVDAIEIAIKPRWRYLDTQHAIAYAAASAYGHQLPSCNSSHYHGQVTVTSGQNSAPGTTLNLYGILLDDESSQPAGGKDKLNIIILPGQHASEDQGSLHGWETVKRYIDATGTEADWFRQHCRLFVYDVNPAGKYYGKERWTLEDDGNEDPNRAYDDTGSQQVNAVRAAIVTDLGAYGNRLDVMYDCHGSYALNGNPYTVEFGIYVDTTNDESFRQREAAAMVADEGSDAQGATFIRNYGSTFLGSASWYGHNIWSAQLSVLPENPAAARGFPSSEAMYYNRRSKWFVTAIKAMVDNSEILLTDTGASIDASTATLALTPNQATVSTGTAILATQTPINLTPETATLSIGSSIGATIEQLTLTALPADVRIGTGLTAGLEQLTLSALPANVLMGTGITAAVSQLALTPNQANVQVGSALVARAENLSLVTNQASLELGINLRGSLQQLDLQTLAASIGLGTNVDALIENLELTPQGATLSLGTSIQAQQVLLQLTANQAEIEAGQQPITIPGLEFTLDTQRLHYTLPINKIHFTLNEED